MKPFGKTIIRFFSSIIILLVVIQFIFISCENKKVKTVTEKKITYEIPLKGKIDTNLIIDDLLKIRISDLELKGDNNLEFIVKHIINQNNCLDSLFQYLNLPSQLSNNASFFIINVVSKEEIVEKLNHKIYIYNDQVNNNKVFFDTLIFINNELCYYFENILPQIASSNSMVLKEGKQIRYYFSDILNSSSILYSLDKSWFFNYISIDSTNIELTDFKFEVKEKLDNKMDFFLISMDFYELFKGNVSSNRINFTNVLPSDDYLLIGIENGDQNNLNYVIKEINNKKTLKEKIKYKKGNLLDFKNELEAKLNKMAPEIYKSKEMLKRYKDSLNANANVAMKANGEQQDNAWADGGDGVQQMDETANTVKNQYQNIPESQSKTGDVVTFNYTKEVVSKYVRSEFRTLYSGKAMNNEVNRQYENSKSQPDHYGVVLLKTKDGQYVQTVLEKPGKNDVRVTQMPYSSTTFEPAPMQGDQNITYTKGGN